MCSNTDRAQPELPPELIDRIIDFLHDVPKALIACSLVARSWTATSRYHRFSEAVLLTTACWAKFDRLIEISPTMIQYIRSIVIDVGCADSTRWISACASFTSLQHIRMAGAITPPWGSEAAAISSVAHKITSLTLNLAVVRRGDIWQIIRMFPNLVSLHYIGAVCVPALEPLLPTLPCYSPPILTISVATTSLGGILDDLSDPPYPLISLLTFDIHDTDPKQGYGLHSLAKAYAGQISRLRLHNRGLPRRYSPDYISRFTNLRYLTFVNLFLTPERYRCGQSAHDGNSFAWIAGVIAALRSPITHLTIEIRVRDPAGLNAMDWTAIDVLLSSREVFRSLVQVSVVFLGEPQNVDWDSIVYPVSIRRMMPLTSIMGLLTFSTRGPKLSAQLPPQTSQHLVRYYRGRRVVANTEKWTIGGKDDT